MTIELEHVRQQRENDLELERQRGAKIERERIIKILKENAEPMRSAGDGWLPYDDAVDLELAIELINGDDK